ncbi:MAG: peroxiredoxin [Alphaproteobacteria bacterium]|nr:peroxiredoxin [Alphaproteobacteria bacterium]
MTTLLEPGALAPTFTAPLTGGGSFDLAQQRGKTVVLYFYPKDDTTGCTQEALDFSAHRAAFEAIGAVIIGVSRDGMKSHERFIAKHSLTIPLAPDEDGTITEAYGVWVEKSMYGRKYMGIERSTFAIDPEGRIKAVWRKVKVTGHAEVVLNFLRNS